MTEYMVLHTDTYPQKDLVDLEKAVDDFKLKGWNCQGGICVVPNYQAGPPLLFFQAMVRDENA